MTVVDASIVVRILQNRSGDSALRKRVGKHRRLHAPTLLDAEVASAVRGLLMTSKPGIGITPERAGEMLQDYADLPIARHPVQPLQRRAIELRHNLTAYDAIYVALAEALEMPLLTDDHRLARSPALPAVIEAWPA